MKTYSFLKVAAFAVCFLFVSVSCSREEIREELNQPQVAAATSATSVSNGDSPEGWTCCAVYGPSNSICGWASDVNNVMNCCHLETLQPNCQWWGNYTQTASNSFGSTLTTSASAINSLILDIKSWALSSRPSGNYIIIGYNVYGTSCGGGCTCLRVVVTYRRMICSLNEPR